MKSNKKWLLPTLIIGCSVILSAVILIAAFWGQGEDSNLPEYTVKFLDNNGELISKVQAVENGFAVPPETLECEGYVFGGWAGSFNRVLSDTECRPNLQAISTDKNVIYANAHYAAANSEITVEIKIGGEVELDTLELTAEFDTEVWTAKKVSSKLGEASINEDKISFKLNEGAGLKSGDTLMTVNFKVGREQFLYNELVFDIKSALYINDNGVTQNADYSVINGKIYSY